MSAIVHRGASLVRVATAALALSFSLVPAFAEDIHLLCGGAPQRVIHALTAEFERQTGHRLVTTFALVTVIQQKLAAGEKADLVLLPMPLIAAVEKTRPMRAEGRGPLARVGVSVIVPDGAARPDISTPSAVRKLLLDARKIAVPQPTTPSGAHFNQMIAKLGIVDAVQAKVIIKAAIDGGGDLVAKGNADVGLYLLSEVQHVKGAAVVGLLPQNLQSFVVYGSAIPANSTAPDAALTFLKFISDPARQSQWKAAGFEMTGG
jgi:molybdate transport system substrate-binding protein